MMMGAHAGCVDTPRPATSTTKNSDREILLESIGCPWVDGGQDYAELVRTAMHAETGNQVDEQDKLIQHFRSSPRTKFQSLRGTTTALGRRRFT